jgi:hypothetical protein
MERKDFRFSRKEVREATGWTDFQVRTHLEKLVALEYVLVHRGARGQSFVYELCYDGKGQDGAPFVMGLVDVETLGGHAYDPNIEHRNGGFEGPSSPQRASIEPPSRVGGEAAVSDGETPSDGADPAKRAHKGRSANGRSYAHPVA